MNSCAVIPQVKGNDGKIKDSRLYKDLLSFTHNNRKTANAIYYRTKNQDFLNDYKDILIFDENNEPTFSSLINVGLNDFISEESIKNTIGTSAGFYKNGKPVETEDTAENYSNVTEAANTFNSNSEYKDLFKAIVSRTDNGTIVTELLRNTENVSFTAKKQEFNYKLNQRIRRFLSEHNIGVGVLNNLDRRLGRKGVADFDISKKETDGLINIIRIAEGSEGEKVLPEEFAHFIVEACEDSPIIIRLVNLFKNREIAETVLGNDATSYNSLTDNQMAHEAAARVLAASLLGENVDTMYSRLVDRANGVVKNRFRKMSIKKIEDMVAQVRKEVDEFTSDIFSQHLQKISKIFNKGSYSNIDSRIQRMQKVLDRMIKQEIRRFEMTERTRTARGGSGREYSAQQRLFVNLLKGHLAAGQFQQGMLSYMEEMSSMINWIDDMVNNIANSSEYEKNSANIRRAADMIASYEPVLTEMRELLMNDPTLSDSDLAPQIQGLVDQLSLKISNTKSKINTLSFDLFFDFLSEYMPEGGIDITIGKRAGHIDKETLKKLLETADHDMSLINTWLDSAVYSTDIAIKLASYAIKERKEASRRRVIDIRKTIQAAAEELKDSGINNFEFMYAKDSKGNYTHQYIGPVNYARYFEAEREMYRTADERYGKNSTPNKRKYIAGWYKANKKNGAPDPVKYHDSSFDELTEAQRKFYDTFMSLRDSLVKLLPDNIFEGGSVNDPMRAIQINKDFIDRILSASGSGDMLNKMWTTVKEQIQIAEDETEFGEIRRTLQDFSGKEILSIPMPFLKKLSDPNDISHDAVSTLISFADMAVNYDEMSKIVGQLEVGKTVMENREVAKESGGKKLISEIRLLGSKETLAVNKTEKRFVTAFNNLLESQVYGKYSEDAGDINIPVVKTVNIQKATSLFARLTSMMQIGFSPIVAISSGLSDIANVNSEAVAGEFFNMKELMKADSAYFKGLFSYLGEFKNPVKTSKLALFLEKFNVLADYENEVRAPEYQKSFWKKLFSTNTVYFMLRMGSHFGQSRTAIAQAMNLKLKDTDGNPITLWDALEVQYIDPSNPDYGARLVLKDGVTKEDGTAFSETDETQFTNSVIGLNHRLYGVYNQGDKNALQRKAWGKLLFMYRNWMVTALNRRFAASDYDMMTNSEVEGYYRTAWRFITRLAADLKEAKFAVATRWNELSDYEKGNLKRAITEITTLALLTICTSWLMTDWEDKDNPWAMRMSKYFARRLQTEIGAMTPSLGMLQEMGRLVKSPMASIQITENALNFISNILNPLHWGIPGVGDEYILQSGKYEGHSRLYKSFMDNVPVVNQIYRFSHPEESMGYFNQ